MKLTKRTALYVAGAILLAAAIISQFKNADLIWATLMVFASALSLLWGYKEDKKLKNCNTIVNSKTKILGVTLGVATILFGIGFTIGRLIYLWSHIN